MVDRTPNYNILVLVFMVTSIDASFRSIYHGERMAVPKRKYRFSITDFGAVGDNKTVNTQAFVDAIAKAQTVAKNGGCYLLIPAGCWVTAPFNLTSHFTLHLSKGATLRAVGEESKDQWPLLPTSAKLWHRTWRSPDPT
mmetsp:Transcript_15769/g.25211  ORF Transcript_15769/g.25211 Transcript_15769/m.25211 type:complete len:139 (-) Transcript_15769:38-454(-)